MPVLDDAIVQEMVDKGEARRFDFKDGYVVLQKFDDVLFILIIKFRNLNFPALLEAFKQMARIEGCQEIQGVGRKGWIRKLKPFGFTQLPDKTLVLTKEFIYGR